MENSRFLAFVANLMMPCCVIDSGGNVLIWNTGMHTLTELPEKEAIGQPLHALGIFAETLNNHWETMSQAGIASRYSIKINQQTYLTSCIPLPNSEWSIIVEDQQINSTPDYEAKDMMSTVVHDLKNPLTGIKGYVDLVEASAVDNTLTQKQQHFLNKIDAVVDDMLKLVSQLLDVAWIDSGMKPDLQSVRLAHVVHNLADNFTNPALNQEVNLRFEVEQTPPVMCDKILIKQVINNLISNAIKYSPAGGEVVVSVRLDNERVIFEVSDQGIGIPSEFLDKIFQRFFRVPGEFSEKINGKGLGLSISYNILQKHGETLKVVSVLGKGSRFYFTLPFMPNMDSLPPPII